MRRIIFTVLMLLLLSAYSSFAQNGDTISSRAVREQTVYTESEVRSFHSFYTVVQPIGGCWFSFTCGTGKKRRFRLLSVGGHVNPSKSLESATIGLSQFWNNRGLFTELELGTYSSFHISEVNFQVSKYVLYLPKSLFRWPVLRLGAGGGLKFLEENNAPFARAEVAVPFYWMNGHVFYRYSRVFKPNMSSEPWNEVGMKFYLYLNTKDV